MGKVWEKICIFSKWVFFPTSVKTIFPSVITHLDGYHIITALKSPFVQKYHGYKRSIYSKQKMGST